MREIVISSPLAASILDHLGYYLQDLSLEYGDIVITDGDISHQLLAYDPIGTIFLVGYVYCCNDIYYVKDNNYRSADRAAIDLIDPESVKIALAEILDRKLHAIDFF